MKKVEIAERYSVPTKHESAPYGTLVKVITGMNNEQDYTFYIQAHKNELKPEWLTMADFLETALEEMFEDPAFLEETITMYQMARIRKKSVFDHT